MQLVFLPSTRSDLSWMRTYYTSVFPIHRMPFSVIYRVVDDRIEVLRIRDQRGDRAGIV